MFKISKNQTFTRDVTVSKPVDGGFSDETMKATYRVIGTTEAKQYDLSTADGSTAFLVATIVKLDDLEDEAGKAVSYNNAVRDELLDVPYVRRALADGYFAGMAGAKTGN
ncbi:MAG: hypothetical protein GC182_03180 [Rhodopseudomonas sp.]|nr:hypothetical protein [Rhodopseudomonas sp.]